MFTTLDKINTEKILNTRKRVFKWTLELELQGNLGGSVV